MDWGEYANWIFEGAINQEGFEIPEDAEVSQVDEVDYNRSQEEREELEESLEDLPDHSNDSNDEPVNPIEIPDDTEINHIEDIDYDRGQEERDELERALDEDPEHPNESDDDNSNKIEVPENANLDLIFEKGGDGDQQESTPIEIPENSDIKTRPDTEYYAEKTARERREAVEAVFNEDIEATQGDDTFDIPVDADVRRPNQDEYEQEINGRELEAIDEDLGEALNDAQAIEDGAVEIPEDADLELATDVDYDRDVAEREALESRLSDIPGYAVSSEGDYEEESGTEIEQPGSTSGGNDTVTELVEVEPETDISNESGSDVEGEKGSELEKEGESESELTSEIESEAEPELESISESERDTDLDVENNQDILNPVNEEESELELVEGNGEIYSKKEEEDISQENQELIQELQEEDGIESVEEREDSERRIYEGFDEIEKEKTLSDTHEEGDSQKPRKKLTEKEIQKNESELENDENVEGQVIGGDLDGNTESLEEKRRLIDEKINDNTEEKLESELRELDEFNEEGISEEWACTLKEWIENYSDEELSKEEKQELLELLEKYSFLRELKEGELEILKKYEEGIATEKDINLLKIIRTFFGMVSEIEEQIFSNFKSFRNYYKSRRAEEVLKEKENFIKHLSTKLTYLKLIYLPQTISPMRASKLNWIETLLKNLKNLNELTRKDKELIEELLSKQDVSESDQRTIIHLLSSLSMDKLIGIFGPLFHYHITHYVRWGWDFERGIRKQILSDYFNFSLISQLSDRKHDEGSQISKKILEREIRSINEVLVEGKPFEEVYGFKPDDRENFTHPMIFFEETANDHDGKYAVYRGKPTKNYAKFLKVLEKGKKFVLNGRKINLNEFIRLKMGYSSNLMHSKREDPKVIKKSFELNKVLGLNGKQFKRLKEQDLSKLSGIVKRYYQDKSPVLKLKAVGTTRVLLFGALSSYKKVVSNTVRHFKIERNGRIRKDLLEINGEEWKIINAGKDEPEVRREKRNLRGNITDLYKSIIRFLPRIQIDPFITASQLIDYMKALQFRTGGAEKYLAESKSIYSDFISQTEDLEYMINIEADGKVFSIRPTDDRTLGEIIAEEFGVVSLKTQLNLLKRAILEFCTLGHGLRMSGDIQENTPLYKITGLNAAKRSGKPNPNGALASYVRYRLKLFLKDLGYVDDILGGKDTIKELEDIILRGDESSLTYIITELNSYRRERLSQKILDRWFGRILLKIRKDTKLNKKEKSEWMIKCQKLFNGFYRLFGYTDMSVHLHYHRIMIRMIATEMYDLGLLGAPSAKLLAEKFFGIASENLYGKNSINKIPLRNRRYELENNLESFIEGKFILGGDICIPEETLAILRSKYYGIDELDQYSINTLVKDHILFLFIPSDGSPNLIFQFPNFNTNLDMAESSLKQEIEHYLQGRSNLPFARLLNVLINSHPSFLHIFDSINSFSTFLFGTKDYIGDKMRENRKSTLNKLFNTVNKDNEWILPNDIKDRVPDNELNILKRIVKRNIKRYILKISLGLSYRNDVSTWIKHDTSMEFNNLIKRIIAIKGEQIGYKNINKKPYLNDLAREGNTRINGEIIKSKIDKYLGELIGDHSLVDTFNLIQEKKENGEDMSYIFDEIGIKGIERASKCEIHAENFNFLGPLKFLKSKFFKRVELRNDYCKYKKKELFSPVAGLIYGDDLNNDLGIYKKIPLIVSYLQEGGPLDISNLRNINKKDCSHKSEGIYFRKLFENDLFGFRNGEAHVYEGSFYYQPLSSDFIFTGHIDCVLGDSLNELYAIDYKPDLNLEVGNSPGKHFLQKSPQMSIYGLYQQLKILGEANSHSIMINRQGAIQFNAVEMYMDILKFMAGGYFSQEDLKSVADEYQSKYKGSKYEDVFEVLKIYQDIIPSGPIYNFLRQFRIAVLKIIEAKYGKGLTYFYTYKTKIDDFLEKIDQNVEKEILKRLDSHLEWISEDMMMQLWLNTYSIEQTRPFLEKLCGKGGILRLKFQGHTYYQIKH